ncbi:MAG TPA: 6-phosphogluconolactonase [Candidatus Polarisedimenticolia bacterium]|jgi:6-phosphogluconolactonase
MSPMPTPGPINEAPLRIEICKDGEDLARHAAGLFVALAGKALGARRQFTVALAGGRTPRRMYELLTEDHYAYQVVWPAVRIFWSDERCVAPDDGRSNYRMALETMLSKVKVPPGNIHRMKGEEDPASAAASCEKDLRDRFDGPPRIDLILLGMGTDGHVASLFPASPALEERESLVTVSRDPEGLARLTYTLPLINAARAVAILVSGEEKAPMLRRVLGAGARDEGLPVQRVRPADGQLIWLLDQAAGSTLESPHA